MPLDEKALRREGFQADLLITLADKQTWSFPRPRVKLKRSAGNLVERVTLWDGYAELLDSFEAAVAALLQHNYSLTAEDVDSLLEFDADDPGNRESWGKIMATARGRFPKAEGLGGGAS